MVVSNTSTATEEERALEHMVAGNEGASASRIVDMILKWLPVKSLIRFKSVSKSFCRGISSSQFFIDHSLHSLSQRRPQLLFRLHDPDLEWEGTNFRLVYKFCTTDLQGKILSRFSVRLHQDPIKLTLPSCMGLLCFATEKGIGLCNPSTNENLELPPSPLLYPGDKILGFGFGYLDSIQGFKVVQLMLRASGSNSLSPKIQCWVFNLTRSISWNRPWRLMRENCPYLVIEFSYPAFVKETIYWKIDRSRYTNLWRNNDFLVAFNIKEEKFRVITHPVDWTYSTDRYSHIVELSERLCLVEIWDSFAKMWFLEDPDNCIWSDPKGVSTTSNTVHRQVRVAELQSYVRCNGLFVFSSSEENVVVFCGTKQRTFRALVFPFNGADFICTYFGGLYPLRC